MTQNVSGVIMLLWTDCYPVGPASMKGTTAALFLLIVVVSFLSKKICMI